MEFIRYDEVMGLLKGHGVKEAPAEEDRVYLEMEDGKDVVHLHLACHESTAAPREGASVVQVEKKRLPTTVEQIIQRLRLNQVLLIPVCKWRKVFDAVAFSLADNEEWQEMDATATVKLNTRDPLLCEPGDFHMLNALMKVLINDADSPDQGLTLTTTATPVTVEIVPDGAVRISVGNQVLADEVVEAFGSGEEGRLHI